MVSGTGVMTHSCSDPPEAGVAVNGELAMVEEFGSDAVRYWACNGRPGTDTALDTGIMKIGRRLAIKILNASKFALGRLGDNPAPGVAAVHDPLPIAAKTVELA